LALAERFDWLTGQVAPARTVDGELRWKMVTDLKGIVYAVIFTPPRGPAVDHQRAARQPQGAT
jgi:hypothetical protein